MSMLEWAENEVRIACNREAPERKDDEWDYGCACYESALKAFKSLCEDGHSGMSFGFTRGILNRLMENCCLTPIEDTPDVWEMSYTQNDGSVVYQCKRMSRLFKTVKQDGSVSYSDVDRYYCHSSERPDITFTGGIVGQMIDEWFPITMPYYPPTQKYVFCVCDYLTDKENGDFDTVFIGDVVTPDGKEEHFNKAFAEKDGKFVEIGLEELMSRVEKHYKRIKGAKK